MKRLKKVCLLVARFFWTPIYIVVPPVMPSYIVTLMDAIEVLLHPEKREAPMKLRTRNRTKKIGLLAQLVNPQFVVI